VSWGDCQEFLKRLNEREKDDGWLYRLPTEAEWEYSCRGGATSKEDCSFDYYFKDNLTNDLSSDQANFDGNNPAGNALKGKYLERTTKVGSYPANALGIFDMHGNVWEWCQDWYEEGSSRVFRGGSWNRVARGCRVAYRDWGTPGYRVGSLGLRVARVPSGKWQEAVA
jgi:formylglycine-generating enzyme required for sulfatase activity